MPASQQRLVFCASGAVSLTCAMCAAAAAAVPRWLDGSVLCRTGAELVNATGPELDKFVGPLSYGLLAGRRVKQCGLGGRQARFHFFPELLDAIPVGLHVSVLFFCAVVVLFSSVASGFFFFNAFGRPYETLQGPLGLYLWTSISCEEPPPQPERSLAFGERGEEARRASVERSRLFQKVPRFSSFSAGLSSCLVLVLFACEVKIHRLSDRIANFREETFVFQAYGERYDSCFWLFFLVFLLQGLDFLLVRLAGVRLPFQEPKGAEVGAGAADLMY